MSQIPTSNLAPQLLISMVPTPLYEAAPLVLGTHVLLGLWGGIVPHGARRAQATHTLHT